MIEKILFFFGWRQNWAIEYKASVPAGYRDLIGLQNLTRYGEIQLAIDSPMDEKWPSLIKHVIRQEINSWPAWIPRDSYIIQIESTPDGWSRP